MRAARRVSLHPVGSALLLVACLYVGARLGLDSRAFWVVDNACKFLQVQALEASGGRDLSLRWAGQALDPAHRWSPLSPPFGVVEGGRLHAFYPPAFALLSVLPHRALGAAGLLLLPLLSGIALAVGVARAARVLGADARGRAAAVLVAALGTPLWFYSEVFWEHAPAACLAFWGVEGVLRFQRDGRRRDLARGCALAALSLWLREELACLCVPLGVVAIASARGRRLAAAATAAVATAPVLLLLAAFQAAATGHPLGFHAVAGFAPDAAAHLRERLDVVERLLLATVPDPLASLALAGPVLVALALAPRVSTRTAAWLAPALAAFAALGTALSLAGYVRAQSPIRWMMATNGLLAAAPVLALAGFRFAEPRDAPVDPRLATSVRTIALATVALHVAVAPLASSTGVHWGNRFLLVILPLLALLAGPNLARWLELFARTRPPATALVGAAVVLSLGAQVTSLHLLREKLRFSRRLADAVTRHPGLPIATGIFWVPLELSGEFATRPLFRVDSREAMRALAEHLHEQGYPAYLAATLPGTANAGTLVERVEDPALGFYDLELVRVDLEPR